MNKFWKSTSLLLTPLMVIGLQVGTLGAAQAAGNADLRLDTRMNFSDSALQVEVKNEGTDDVVEFELSHTLSNYSFNDAYVMVAFSEPYNGSDIGSYDLNTNTWTGTLKQDDKIVIIIEGEVSGPVGSSVSIDSSIDSSQLAGPVANIDPNDSNDSSSVSFTSKEKADANVSTRLKTTGAITPTTNVTYEATVSSDGPGALVYNGFFILAFIMPEDSTFVNAADTDPTDDLSLIGCDLVGPIANLGFQALATFEYTGDVVACSLSHSVDLEPGSEFKFDLNMTAGQTFAEGNGEVIVVVETNDVDTLSIFRALAKNTDPLSENNGNFLYLSYDPSVLAATASLCPGQPEVSSDGTGCFRISFNKDIVESTFGIDDFAVTGSGTVSSLLKIGPNVWEVRITGIESGKAATITLLTNDILDFSAVESRTSVLGINTIRFESGAPVGTGNVNSANGTLANTGSNTTLALNAFALLLAGFALMLSSRKKKIVSRARYSL